MKFLNIRHFLFFLLLTIISSIVYAPSLSNEYVNWDDNDYIYDNNVVLESNWNQPFQNIRSIFSQKMRNIYTPLTIGTYTIEKSLFGIENPKYWHFDNILLHSIVSFLVFLICTRLGFTPFICFLTSLLFTIHPMRVESVAWLTARKDLLMGLFMFSGLWFYLKHREKNKFLNFNYLLVWLCFISAILSKIVAVAFPLLLIGFDIYLDKGLDKKRLIYKFPFLLLSLLVGLMAIIKIDHSLAPTVDQYFYNLLERIALGSTALLRYSYKLFFPYPMVPVYNYPKEIGPGNYASIAIWIPYLALLYLTYIKEKWIYFFGILFFLANIVFVLQIIPVGQGYSADRYTYIAYFGLFLIMSSILQQFFAKYKPKPGYKYLAVITILGSFGIMAYNQSKIWKNSETLWTHQISSNNNSAIAHKNIAAYYQENNLADKSYYHLNQAIRLEPNDPANNYNLGMLIYKFPDFGSKEESLKYLNKTLELDSTYSGVYINKAVILAQLGQMDNAVADLEKAEKITPLNPDIYLNKAVIQKSSGNIEAAVISLTKFLELKPSDPDKWIILGQMLAESGDFYSALEAIEKGIQIRSEGIYHFEKAIILENIGRLNEAKQEILTSRKKGYNERQIIAERILNK